MEVFNTVAYQEFSLVHRQENGGLLSLLIGRKGSILQLQDIFSCKVSAGYLYTGHAVVTRFQIENTSLCFANVDVAEQYAAELLRELMDQSFKQDRDMHYQKYTF